MRCVVAVMSSSGVSTMLHADAYIVRARRTLATLATVYGGAAGTDDARVGGTDEQELAEYKLEHVDLEGAEKSGEILRIERC